MIAELYPQIFFEAAHTATIFPLGHEPTLYAMKAFGNYAMGAPIALALAGATFGQMINWWLGTLLLGLREKRKMFLSDERYQRIKTHFHRWGFYLLLLCGMTFGNLFAVAAGFFGLSPKKILPVIVLGLAAHYGMALL
jgi:membrane protein YqaA with SNARE-associated domain